MFQHMIRSLVASSARLARYTTKADATRLEAARSASLADRSALAAELSGRWIVATGAPQQTESAGDSFGFALRVDEVNLGVLRAALFPAPPKQRRDEGHLRTALIFGASCHPGLPLSLAAKPLVEAARAELAQRGAERVMGLAPLTGLCGWVVEEQAWERLSSLGEFGDEAAGAVEAVARGVPRPGHSVLGQGTFSAAQKAFEALATAYARRDDPESECLAYLEAGADLAAVHWLHDTSQEAVRDRAGVSASLEFGAYSPAAEATADELYMPSSGIYTPPGGEAS